MEKIKEKINTITRKGFCTQMTCVKCKQDMTVVSFPIFVRKLKNTTKYKSQTITSHDEGCPK